MNFILAFFIFVIIGFVQGVPVDKPMVGKVMGNSAAEQAGLKERRYNSSNQWEEH